MLMSEPVWSQEEAQKRHGRAARFGQAPTSLSYEPVRPIEDMQQLKARAERFNMEFKPPDLTGLATEGASITDATTCLGKAAGLGV